jgi:hypothetical protein
MYIVLDTETKCVVSDNEKLLSVQIGDNITQKLFWADSKEAEWNLEGAKREIVSLLSQGVVFVGYKIDFDTEMVKQFFEVEVPKKQTLDLCHTAEIEAFHKLTKDWSLEHACKKYYVNADHKRKINEKAQQYKNKADIQGRVKSKALDLAKKKGWTAQWTYDTFKDRILDNMIIGHAIYQAHLEFVECGGQKNTIFYEYAIGDVTSEYQLLKALGY